MNKIISIQNAEEYIIQMFGDHNIIGLGEGEHNLVNSHQFFHKIIDNKKIQDTIEIIIVEFANAGYQDILDRYILGEEVSIDELRKVWRESTQCISLFGEASIYLNLLKKIRNVNFALPENKKIRVLGGDPPVEWSSISCIEDYLKINIQRDSFAASLAIDYGIKCSMKVLMIYSEYHLTRISDESRNNMPAEMCEKSITDFLTITNHVNTKFPDAMQVIAVLDPNKFCITEKAHNWPLYSVIDLKQDEIGNFPAESYFTQIFDESGQVTLFKNKKTKELFDAFLYIGRSEDWKRVDMPTIDISSEELKELNRRRQIFGIAPLSSDEFSLSNNNTRVYVDADLVSRLVRQQFPEWQDLPVQQIIPGGWDNKTFRLGNDKIIRMPTALAYTGQIEKEKKWLPKLAPLLPLPIPVPVAIGKPGEGYPFAWSVLHYLPGVDASSAAIPDLSEFAASLAQFLLQLQRIDPTGGPLSGPHNFYRGSNLEIYDAETRRAISLLKNRIDKDTPTKIWETALSSRWTGKPVWVHGDISAGNLLVEDGKLSAVIDFGQLAVGDPACDLAIAWTFFKDESRDIFRKTLHTDAATWARARGWALWKALIVAAGLTNPGNYESRQCLDIICELVNDFKELK